MQKSLIPAEPHAVGTA